jgi:uncharacterized protein YjbI with pentapeptide repeats
MNIVLDTPEAAERAAWMLRGKYVNEMQIEVPENNTNSETIDAVALMVGSSWRWADESADNDDFFGHNEPSTPEAEEEPTEPRVSHLDRRISTLEHEMNRIAIRSLAQFEVVKLSHAMIAKPTEAKATESRSSISTAVEPNPPETNQQRFERLHSRGYSLSGENFSGIDLSNRTLTKIDFNFSDLSGSNFDNTRLVGCSFVQANLRKASFKNAQMPGANLYGSCLYRANFESANLCAAQIDWVNLQDAILCNANLSNANLQSTNLLRVDCSDADLSDANLEGTRFYRTTCIGANFHAANLTRANFNFANLSGALFSHAVMDFVSLRGSEGFKPERHKHIRYYHSEMPDCETRGTIKHRTGEKWLEIGAVIFGMIIAVTGSIYSAVVIYQEHFAPKTAYRQPAKSLKLQPVSSNPVFVQKKRK